MTARRLVTVALQSLRRHVLRGLLTVLGVVIGVGSVVVMVGIGEGAQAEIAARIATLGTHLVVVTPGTTASRSSSRVRATTRPAPRMSAICSAVLISTRDLRRNTARPGVRRRGLRAPGR